MINYDKLKNILAEYKADFNSFQWNNEKYKWEAVKHFQDHWDINADDFGKMFMEATEKTYNLLASMNNFPRRMIKGFAEADGEATRAMFINLYDENKSLEERVNQFQADSEAMRSKYGAQSWKQHYQNTNSISVYLWLRYPDKYYIYKYSDCRAVAKELDSELIPKKGYSSENLRKCITLYDEICKELSKASELLELLQGSLTESCYKDEKLKTLTNDIAFYTSHYYTQSSEPPKVGPEGKDAEKGEGDMIEENKLALYSREDFLSEVYMDGESFDSLVSLLRNKKNIILQGAPGVGKTFAAKRLAYAMMGEKDQDRIEFIQFHQNYSYEDFILGYKPHKEGFELKEGVFYRFCHKAASNPDKPYFFIIDEINRGNMSKIFGELLMLIERDYRGTDMTLAYNDIPFSVPKNLYIIGMMNTADRSLAMIDYALRRRFSFFEMEPAFSSDGFREYKDSLDNDSFNTLIERVKELNTEIITDNSLGKGFAIGHSYFCGRNKDNCTDEWMMEVILYDIIPMLSEYWFDEPAKLQCWENLLNGVFND